MEENKINTLTEFVSGTMNEDNVAKVFSINLDNEETEKTFKELLDSLYEDYNVAEDKEEGSGASIIAEYAEKIDAIGTKSEPQPKLTTSDKGTFCGIFLAPINHKQRITDYLTDEAKTDEELAKAIAEGKKTFEGCDRFIRNNMKDLMREMKSQECQFDDEAVHMIARWYMVNPDVSDVQNAVKEIKKTETKKKETKSSKKNETKKTEPKKTATEETKKTKKGAKVLPLTPQMGSLFADEDFE